MLFETKQYMNSVMSNPSVIPTRRGGSPVFNEPVIFGGYPYGTQPTSYKDIRKYIKRSAEAMGIFMAIITDTMSDGVSFVGPKMWTKKAEEFVDSDMFIENLEASMMDRLIYGDGYIWIGKSAETVLKEASVRLGMEYKIAPDEIVSAMDYKYNFTQVPASTMHINFNRTEITEYRQAVNSTSVSGIADVIWQPDEIIHARFWDYDGKVYGLSPTEICLPEISTLILLKDYAGTFFDNGAVPDWMFILPKEMAGSPNHDMLVQVLRERKDSRAKHGSLVFTGEVEPKELNKFNKDMEFRQLAIYYTGILALSFNMPLSRVMSIIGSDVGGSATDTSEEGYWRRISKEQDYWERLLNDRFFKPRFHCKIRFNRSYKQDEVRESQIMMTRVDTLSKLKYELGVPINIDYVKMTLKLMDEDLEKQEFDKPMDEVATNRKGKLSNMDLLSKPSKINQNEAKRAEQLKP